MKSRYFFLLTIGLFFLSAASVQEELKMKVWSPAFEYGAKIPSKYSCDGANLSIPVSFDHVPEGSRSLVLIMDDPDAPGGDFVHWVVYNIPPDTRELPEGAAFGKNAERDIRQGRNDFGKNAYGGPCPPAGTHRYFIRLYALDIPSRFESGLSRDALLKRIEGHVLARALWMGRYSR